MQLAWSIRQKNNRDTTMAFALKTCLLTFLVRSIRATEYSKVQLDLGHGDLEPVSVTYDAQTHVLIIDHRQSEGHYLIIVDRLKGVIALKAEGSNICRVGKATVELTRTFDEITMALRTHKAIVSVPHSQYTFLPSTGFDVGNVIRNVCEGRTIKAGRFSDASFVAQTRKYTCWGISVGNICLSNVLGPILVDR